MANKNKGLSTLLDTGKFEPFIRYIRFPSYKNLEKDFKLTFDFPITALVGQNGTNKSSVLRAIYGCPGGYSTGNYWFSTHLDPILDTDGRPRFIYGYDHPKSTETIEVLKQRTHDKKNPDYWEPAPPKKSDGMLPMSANWDGDKKYRSKTRWNTIEKEVLLIDFRSELSAFDQFFYFGKIENSKAFKSKQDVLRKYSQKLSIAIKSGKSSFQFYKHKVYINKLLDSKTLQYVNSILEKNYSEIRWVEHSYFGKSKAVTVILTNDHLTYTEAFAGSGEFAVVSMVEKILNLPKASLILLDEPEVSLYPAAQERVLDFLIEKSLKKHHQFVFTTHSPFFVKKLPSKAIKTLYPNFTDGKISVINNSYGNEAFHHLGINNEKISIYVEDKLAREIVMLCLRRMTTANKSSYEVTFIDGGANILLEKFLPAFANTNKTNNLFILDGDMKKEVDLTVNVEELSEIQLESNLKEVLGDKFTLPLNSNPKISDKLTTLKQIFVFVQNNLNYLPFQTPEQFIWDNMIDESIDLSLYNNEECYKKKFELLTRNKLNVPSDETVTSDDIFSIQRLMLATINEQFDNLFNWLKTHNSGIVE